MVKVFYIMPALIFLILSTSCVELKTNKTESDEWINVSHSRGAPLGGLGNGYSIFGQYGFIKVNFVSSQKREVRPSRFFC